ncbi:hypothetical protein PHJA_002176100 [Phtheirospermum japonicum]|uniref:GCK domain-containing protein n=1 Tax=Phtheirospermum japonicum TaxID=374723 RepID=A0A830CKH9_9LAMI|nr:hypothetical protein PHJA_002176100 [Phtheirospermum japonicum]
MFMKGGECKETFTEWEKCVEEGEKNEEDIVGKCYQAIANLKKCMEEHFDYYALLLQAEKVAEAEAVKQLEEERESSNKEEGSREKGKEENLGVSDEKQYVQYPKHLSLINQTPLFPTISLSSPNFLPYIFIDFKTWKVPPFRFFLLQF